MQDDFGQRSVRVSAFQTGGRVRETGLAVVHEGELIVPAAGSEAVIEPTALSTEGVVNYYFPVEIVVVGELPPAEREAIEARVWQQLSDAIDRLA